MTIFLPEIETRPAALRDTSGPAAHRIEDTGPLASYQMSNASSPQSAGSIPTASGLRNRDHLPFVPPTPPQPFNLIL